MTQVIFNPWYADWDRERYCREHGIVLTAYAPMGDIAKWSQAPLPAMAARLGKTVPQVLLRWLMQVGIVPIFGTDDEAHMAANVDVFDFALTASDVAALKEMHIAAYP